MHQERKNALNMKEKLYVCFGFFLHRLVKTIFTVLGIGKLQQIIYQGVIMAEQTNYIRGNMNIVEQDKTFKGFLRASAFLTAFFIVVLLMPILVFSTSLGWFSSLIITFIVGLALAWPFKLGGGWYASLVGLAVLAAITSLLLTALF